MKDERLYLIHIKECIERIEAYLGNANKRKFLNSTLLQDAVIRNLQVLAESTQHLSDEAKESRQDIDLVQNCWLSQHPCPRLSRPRFGHGLEYRCQRNACTQKSR